MPKPLHTTVHQVFQWKYFFLVNFCLVVFISISLGREFIRTHEIQSQIQSLKAQADELQTKNLAITELQTSVQTESYIEREARLKLGLKKPGEQVVILKGRDESSPQTNGAKENSTDPLNMVSGQNASPPKLANSTKWWYYFFHKQAYLDLLPYESRL